MFYLSKEKTLWHENNKVKHGAAEIRKAAPQTTNHCSETILDVIFNTQCLRALSQASPKKTELKKKYDVQISLSERHPSAISTQNRGTVIGFAWSTTIRFGVFVCHFEAIQTKKATKNSKPKLLRPDSYSRIRILVAQAVIVRVVSRVS